MLTEPSPFLSPRSRASSLTVVEPVVQEAAAEPRSARPATSVVVAERVRLGVPACKLAPGRESSGGRGREDGAGRPPQLGGSSGARDALATRRPPMSWAAATAAKAPRASNEDQLETSSQLSICASTNEFDRRRNSSSPRADHLLKSSCRPLEGAHRPDDLGTVQEWQGSYV